MLINRHNYEEFFLLYVDNELTVADRKAVEAFVAGNPDLEEELVMMMQSVLRPDKNVVFSGKESLLKNKPANGLVNENNYEEYFVLYGDNELTNEEKDLVEQFVYKHPQYQAEFELIQQARFIPEHSVSYPDKNELYRSEGDHRVIPVRWWRMAVAAAVVLFFLGVAGWYLMSTGSNGTITPRLAENETKSTEPALADSGSRVAVVNQEKAATEVKNTIKEEPHAADASKNIAAENKEKNKKNKSNNPGIIDVTPKSTEALMASNRTIERRIEVEPRKRINTPIVIETVPTPLTEPDIVVTSVTASSAVLLNKPEPKEVIYVDYTNTPDDLKETQANVVKKTGRALLRKVKGMFDSKEDNNDPGDKKGIRIAAFAFALK